MRCAIDFVADSREHVMPFESRDWKALADYPQQHAAARFMSELGFWEEGAVTREREAVIHALEALVEDIREESELLAFDYALQVPRTGEIPGSSGPGRVHGLLRLGKPVTLYAGHGHCWMDTWEVQPDGQGRVIGRIDLRQESHIELDEVIVKVKKRRVGDVAWLRECPSALDFLRRAESKVIKIQNRHR